MANITINEVSSNYGYNVGSNSYCTVAIPITACWGPAFEDPETVGLDLSTELEATGFTHFASTQEGLEAFISTYRGPAVNYRSAKDFSYQLALTLLSTGYDLDVCRLCPGTHSEGTLTASNSGTITFKAKYPGTFGNNLVINFNKVTNHNYWNMIVYVIDESGVTTAVENKVFVFDVENETNTVLHVSEIESNFVTIVVSGISADDVTFSENSVQLKGGQDRAAEGTVEEMMTDALGMINARFDLIPAADSTDYVAAFNRIASTVDVRTASTIRFREWIYLNTMHVLEILTDKLAYSSNRIVLPGWDDQNITELDGSEVENLRSISPLHARLMEVAYNSRCATAFIDIPKCLPRSAVYNDSPDPGTEGYAQKLSRYLPAGTMTDGLFSTHSGLFAPWGQYTYVGTSKSNIAPPSFLALMIQRAMILNQANQYEWAMPTSRQHSLMLGKLDYTVPKRLLDQWQSIEGVSLNIIADIPDLGISLWGNSTLFEVPVATYNALQNLSTRFLMNAVENVVYRCGISITFQYNNNDAFSKFYAGCSPILDTMKAVGAIEDYKIKMATDINGLDSVNLNSVIGKIWLTISGVINDIAVDLIALPAGVDLSTY